MRVALETAIWRWIGHFKQGKSAAAAIPPEALKELTPDNPKLKQLKERYQAATRWAHSSWSSWEAKVDFLRFRGENDYLSQAYFRDTLKRYEFTTAYVEMIDEMGWLQSFTEDGLFGIKLWNVMGDQRPVSRDLLDSIIEISFLKKALAWDVQAPMRVLDIGAGYGRFAHRFVHAFPQGTATCIDGVATSTFLCDFYLRFRGCSPRATVVPLDQADRLVRGGYDLAVNIHSWSECTLDFIRYWLGVLRDLEVPYLFIVPHFAGLTTAELDGSKGSYAAELEKHGFTPHLKRRKFHPSAVMDRMGIYPADYWIFKRSSG